MENSPFVNEDLCAAAMKIMDARKISFGEALTLARGEQQAIMADSSVSMEQIRQACVAAMEKFAGMVTKGGIGARPVTPFIDRVVESVESALEQIGIRAYLIDGIEADLRAFLNNSLLAKNAQGGIAAADLDVIIVSAADRIVQVYADALRNKVHAEQLSGALVDPVSVVLHDAAMRIASTQKIGFCEALPIARGRFVDMASDVVEPDHVKEIVASALRLFFDKEFEGKEQKMDLNIFGAVEAVAADLSNLNLSQNIVAAIKSDLREFLDGELQGVVSQSGMETIISNAAARTAKVYAQQLKAAQ